MAYLIALPLMTMAQTSWTESGANLYPTNYTTANVGIGTNAPAEKLHINGSIRGNQTGGAVRFSTTYGTIDIGPQNASWAHFQTSMPKFYFAKPITVNGAVSSYDVNDLLLQTNAITRITINNSTGYVGLGTSIPEGRLHVRGVGYFSQQGASGDTYRAVIGASGSSYGGVGYNVKFTTTAENYTYGVSDDASFLQFRSGGFQFKTAPSGTASDPMTLSTRLMINNDGLVGIGTVAVDPSYILMVNGKVKAEEVLVILDVPAADYVFNSNYDLKPLEEVEDYVKTHKHLPGIPSAATIEKDGWLIGEMSNKLLEKVEELTLYLIELKKENEELKKRLEKLEQK